LDPLATADDVQARLGRALTDTELFRIDALIGDASEAVRDKSGQQFTPGTSTTTFRPAKGRIRLPQRPVTAVASVTDIYGNDLAAVRVGDTEYVQLNLSPLNAWEIEPYRCGLTEVVVTYDHGDTEVPEKIVGVVCSIVCRALGMDPANPGGTATQESIDGYAVTTGGGVATSSVVAQGALGMLPSEIEICEKFKRPSSPIVTFA
jgi:hypothetical protein